MGKIAQTIVSRNQDVQLHLHPCWTYFKHADWKEQLTINPPNDDIRRRSEAEMINIIQEGINIFSRWGIEAPVALRTGSLWVNRTVYRAMKNLGIVYSSNVGLGVFVPEEPELELYSGSAMIEECIELPVLSYIDAFKHLKALTITGSSWNEIEYLLLEASRQNINYVVLLTHPSEFVKNTINHYQDFNENRINKKKLLNLCQFLTGQPDKFSV